MRISRVQLVWERLFVVALILSLSAFAVAVDYSPTWASTIALGGVLGMWVLSLLSRRPIWACLGYVALIPLEYVGGLPFGGLSVTMVAGVLAVLTTLAWFVIYRQPFQGPWVEILVQALIFTFVASWWLGAQSSFGAELLFTLITVVATSLVLTSVLFSRKDWRFLLLTLASSTSAYAVITLVYALRSGLLRTDNVGLINRLRSQFLLADPNYLALSLSLGLLASLALLYLDLPRVVKGWVGLCAIVTAGGVAATLSRSGLLVAALGAGFLVLQLSRRQGRWRQVVTWGGLVVAVSLIMGGVALRSRILIAGQDMSIAGRLWALQAGWAMWLDHPVLGIGLGRFADFFLMYAPPSRVYIERMVGHDSWIEILAETGSLGFIAWCSVAIVTAREWFTSSQGVGDREGRVIRAFVGAALLALLVASLALTIHFRKFPWLFIFLAFRIKAVLAESAAEVAETSRDDIRTVVPRISKKRLRSAWPWIVGGAGLMVILAVLISLSPLPERFYLNYMATPTLIARPAFPGVTATVIPPDVVEMVSTAHIPEYVAPWATDTPTPEGPPAPTATSTPQITIGLTPPAIITNLDPVPFTLVLKNTSGYTVLGDLVFLADDDTPFESAEPAHQLYVVEDGEAFWIGERLVNGQTNTYTINVSGPASSGTYTQTTMFIDPITEWEVRAYSSSLYTVTMPTSTPTVTPTPTPATPTPEPPTPTPEPPIPTRPPVVVAQQDKVNVRSGPGTAYPILGQATPAMPLEILGKNAAGDWWQVCCVGNQQGWIIGQLVRVQGDTSGVPVVNVAPPPPTATSGPLPTPTPTPEMIPGQAEVGPGE